MNVRTKIKSGIVAANNTAILGQKIGVSANNSGLVTNVVALNTGVIAQTSVATSVSIGGVSLSLNLKP